MPKRTNLFQEVVEIIHRHMAGDATVESPAMLRSKSTGSLREVDVVIRGEQAGHEVIVSVEAIARSRRADRGWVDRMVGTHADLPTSKLVLVSEKGFTKDARAAALANNAVPLAPEDDARNVIDSTTTVWPKAVMFTIESINVEFSEETTPKDGWDENPPIVFIEDGILGNLMDVVHELYKARLPELMEQIDVANMTEDVVQSFTLVIEPAEGEDLRIALDDGTLKILFLKNADGLGYSLHRIVATGKGDIKVSEVPLMRRRFSDVEVTFAYGEGKVADRDALLVMTERDEGGGHLTVRFRPLESEDESTTSRDHKE